MQLELKRIQQSTGTTFVYVTHDQEEALTMSDRIAVMDGGVVQQVDAPRALYERPATSFVADFIGTSNLLSFAGAARTNGVAVLELGEGMRIVGPGDAGDWITVRPEKIRIGVELERRLLAGLRAPWSRPSTSARCRRRWSSWPPASG